MNAAALQLQGTALTATAIEINRLHGIGSGVTAANLNTLTGGGNADSLHTHDFGAAVGWSHTGTVVNLATSGDSVGIGTGTPQAKLDVDGPIRTNTKLLAPAIDTEGAAALELRSGGQRVLRLEPDAAGPNVIGGSLSNFASLGVHGASIGGGAPLDPMDPNSPANRVTDHFGVVGGGTGNRAGDGNPDATDSDFATVGGGLSNQASARGSVVGGGEQNVAGNLRATVGGGDENLASGDSSIIGGGALNQAGSAHSTVGGGRMNQAMGTGSTVAGGDTNTASGSTSTVGGGRMNHAGGDGSTVAGGAQNEASGVNSAVGGGDQNSALGDTATIAGGAGNAAVGDFSTVPGGRFNSAGGQYSFAAGYRAKAGQTGSFVWADSMAADFASTGADQFLVRASGGVGVNMNNPQKALDVNGTVQGTSNTDDGLSGVTSAENRSGVFGRSEAANGNGYAGFFDGKVTVTGDLFVDGTLSKSAGSFRIDHPLDPANRYLFHSFVESPDMMNVYNGNVVLDAKGQATVELPEWFQALNQDFRYQLTALGAPGPDLYIAQEIEGNRFTIGGGDPGLKVSWMVTGIRHDAYAEAHRIPVEQDKPESERGFYLHPELFGKPAEQGIRAAFEAQRAAPKDPR